MPHIRHIRDCLSPKFAQICVQIRQIDHLHSIVQQYIPEDLHAHCRVIGFQQGCLLLATPNASWASQLRYTLPELRDRLRTEEKWYHLTSIKIIMETNTTLVTKKEDKFQAPKPSPWKSILKMLGSQRA